MFLTSTADQWRSTLAVFPSLLKILVFLLSWLVTWFPVAVVTAYLIKWQGRQPLTGNQKLVLVGTLYLVALVICWGTTQIEGTNLGDYGWNLGSNLVVSIAIGELGGIVGIGALVALELAGGWGVWQGQPLGTIGKILLPTAAIAFLISSVEELIFRGIFINILQQDYSLWVAAAISSAIFALLHLVWEQKETLPQVPGLWLMGMVLVAARIVNQGNLGLAIGLHAGWILAIATIDTAQLLKYPDPPHPWLVGHYGKPLAGVMGISLLLCTGLVLSIIKDFL
jgi:membrane protease YdiL (CAAX protease family)